MKIYFLSIVIIAFFGCATAAHQQKLDLFEKISGDYGVAVRWGRFDLAETFRKNLAQREEPFDANRAKTVKVTSYEPLNRIMSENHLEAVQDVEIKYYFVDRLIERTILDRQVWKYDLSEKKWYLHSNLPEFSNNNEN